MAAKRELNSVLVATIESTEGTAQAATNTTDVVLTENLQIKFNETQQSTAEVTGTLDPSTDIPIGGAADITFDTWLKGSGTAGVAPVSGKLLKCVGYTETIYSVSVSGTSTGTANATDTGSAVQVAPGTFTGTLQPVPGGIVALSGNPTSTIYAGVTAFSAAGVISIAETFSPVLSGATLVNRPPQVVYSPNSTAIPSITLRVYKDGVLSTVAGCRGTMKMAWEAGKGIKVSWSFKGILQEPRTDTPNPTNASPDSAQTKLVWRNDSNNGAFIYGGTRMGCTMLNFDNGTALDSAPNPNQPAGFDVADIGSRTMKGDFNPRAVSIATRDSLADKRAGTTKSIFAMARNSAGNSVALLIPAAELQSYEYEKQGPMIGEKLPFKATGSNAGGYLCFF